MKDYGNMVKRKQITLIYQFDDNWIGGTYYILNIIKALNILDETKKPKLLIVHDKNSDYKVIQDLNYPFIDFVESDLRFNFLEKGINKLSRILLKKPLIKKKLPFKIIENLYPVSDFISTRNVNSFYYWLPDFQEHYLPQFFAKYELESRINTQINIQKQNVPIVFSSESAQNDYNKFYNSNQNKKVILNFASILGDKYKQIPIEVLLSKYGINKPYFMVTNQFWKHKNHEIILKAARILNERKFDFRIIFTGKEYDYRNPDHVTILKKFVADNSLQDKISFLGFIDRDEQLQLMKNSVAIIQPSLFEGWSTVVEDTKALNHFIILSNIPLHKEQMKNNCLFFDPADPFDLAQKMIQVLNGVIITNDNYEDTVLKFAEKFINMF